MSNGGGGTQTGGQTDMNLTVGVVTPSSVAVGCQRFEGPCASIFRA
jgi:hypothetical protein